MAYTKQTAVFTLDRHTIMITFFTFKSALLSRNLSRSSCFLHKAHFKKQTNI